MPKKDERVELLRKTQLFCCLSTKELRAIADEAKEIDFKEGFPIVSEGEDGGRFHIVLEGKATVTVRGKTVATLGPGDNFGEISLIDGGPRLATVTADTPVRTMSIARFNFLPLLKEIPSITEKLLVQACARLREVEASFIC